MTDVKLVGVDETEDYDYFLPNNYLELGKFTAEKSGTVSAIHFYSRMTATAHWKFAIYSDSSGSPGTVLASTGEITTTKSGWQTASISATLVSGTVYWLAFVSDTSLGSTDAGTGVQKYKSMSYSGSSFTNNPTELTDGTRIIKINAWGAEAAAGGNPYYAYAQQ